MKKVVQGRLFSEIYTGAWCLFSDSYTCTWVAYLQALYQICAEKIILCIVYSVVLMYSREYPLQIYSSGYLYYWQLIWLLVGWPATRQKIIFKEYDPSPHNKGFGKIMAQLRWEQKLPENLFPMFVWDLQEAILFLFISDIEETYRKEQ